MHRLRFISILLITVVQNGCVKKAMIPSVPPYAAPPIVVPAKKYLALGDSYTIGQGVPLNESYPVQTKKWLGDNGITGMAEPLIIATTGWTTENLQAALATQKPRGPFQVVSLLIGVNDQYRRMDIKGYETRFTQLLQQAIGLANNLPSHVFVLSIPDYSVTPFAAQLDKTRIAKEIDEFNAVNKQVALSMNVNYLDITASTREAPGNPLLICPDGLHPSGIEYKKWAERLGPIMKDVLN
jgi:lysophospholipase L1-like esterase